MVPAIDGPGQRPPLRSPRPPPWPADASRGAQWMASLPLLVAGWIAVSRTRDHHHRWVDISAGAGIGAAAALATFAARVPAMRASLEGARKGVPQ